MTERQKIIAKLRSEGLTYSEIQKRTGYDQHNVRKTCINLGIDYTEAERDTADKRLEAVKQRLSGIGLEYVGGYENNRSRVTVKGECGHKFELAWQSLIDSRCAIRCPVCRKVKKSNRERDAQLKRMEREAYHGVQMEFGSCPVCGAMVIGERKTYCSDACARKAWNASHEARRRSRCRHKEHDVGISLEAVFKRSDGLCWICGRSCEFKDCVTRDGVFIAGDLYPSIDHVIALSDGGTHTWGNVLLAHKGCNTRRYWYEHLHPRLSG